MCNAFHIILLYSLYLVSLTFSISIFFSFVICYVYLILISLLCILFIINSSYKYYLKHILFSLLAHLFIDFFFFILEFGSRRYFMRFVTFYFVIFDFHLLAVYILWMFDYVVHCHCPFA